MRSSSFPLKRPLLLLLLASLILPLTGCSYVKNRDWPWFWRAEPDDSFIYINPDIEPITPQELPQPVDVLFDTPLPPEPQTTLPQPRRPPAPETPTQIVSDLQTVYFAFDSYALSPRVQEQLEQNARWVLGHSGITIQIEGHCDERGTNEYNMNLGQERADTVREYLYKLGVPALQLTTISWGEERPADQGHGHDESAWAKNRRAQFLIY